MAASWSKSIRTRPETWLLLLVGAAALADEIPYEFGGHTKLRFIGTTFPSDSAFRPLAGRRPVDPGEIGEITIHNLAGPLLVGVVGAGAGEAGDDGGGVVPVDDEGQWVAVASVKWPEPSFRYSRFICALSFPKTRSGSPSPSTS